MTGSLILTGCGGSGAAKSKTQTVSGPGLTFVAPAGWKVSSTARQASATNGPDLVQAARFALLKPYRPALYDRVAPELERQMAAVARRTGGTLSASSTVSAAGIRSHSYRVSASDHTDQYTFVLRGMTEYQLLCRRRPSEPDEVCARLIASFRTSA